MVLSEQQSSVKHIEVLTHKDPAPTISESIGRFLKTKTQTASEDLNALDDYGGYGIFEYTPTGVKFITQIEDSINGYKLIRVITKSQKELIEGAVRKR